MNTEPASTTGVQPIKRHPLFDHAALLFAGFLYAVALKYFVLPTKVILTGTEGVAAALSYFFESEWLFIGLYLLFQATLLTFAWFKVSRTFARRSLMVVATVVVMLSVLPSDVQFGQPDASNERLILVIFGGLITGVAKAIAFQRRGSTGDEDVVGAYFAMKYLKPVGVIAIIAGVAATAFGLTLDFIKTFDFEAVINTLMYTCIYIFISAETLNNLYRKFKLTMITVVTRNEPAVGEAIKSTRRHRTYTSQEGTGGHSQTPFRMVRTIVTHEELPSMLTAIQKADPACFYYHFDLEGISSRYYIEPIG